MWSICFSLLLENRKRNEYSGESRNTFNQFNQYNSITCPRWRQGVLGTSREIIRNVVSLERQVQVKNESFLNGGGLYFRSRDICANILRFSSQLCIERSPCSERTYFVAILPIVFKRIK